MSGILEGMSLADLYKLEDEYGCALGGPVGRSASKPRPARRRKNAAGRPDRGQANRALRTLEIRRATRSLPQYGRGKRPEIWVLTRGGRPVAAVVPIDDESPFSIRLANDPRFIELIQRSRASYRATGGISLAGMRRKYRVPAKAKRPSAPRKV